MMSEEKKFDVKIKVVCGHPKSIADENKIIEESYCVQEKFEDFDRVL